MKSWMQELKRNITKKRKILFSRDSSCLLPLQLKLSQASHEQVITWAMSAMRQPSSYLLEHYPDDPRPSDAIRLTTEWHQEKIKMTPAKRAILALHAMAKTLTDPVAQAYCHALGHACATVHVATHAIGLPLYELTGLVLDNGFELCEDIVEATINRYEELLDLIMDNLDTVSSV